jgi:hypothetical protein
MEFAEQVSKAVTGRPTSGESHHEQAQGSSFAEEMIPILLAADGLSLRYNLEKKS